ncbi:hypothetical protein CH63R_06620 [Colletotrichum higginsianum IMI 349063]|uniref:Uncharacterized protein n=4 Tax=Colletotrichum higginsianum TaxID=80884 RepID=A0A1B7YGJ8_COLHI|nr:hypothetical protein CH63R_06620 [Colletotrichum higginsianum IMI 349063]OBR10928.1 hypothetical protein CH63R_06620 [Colletotrichum higginsianum IMI 349063]TID06889.1 hypothetical protein CH35J_000845 [Colletotrichum higginsianum]
MSRLSPFPSEMTFRTESRASDRTYYTCAYQSFNDVELYAPGSPPSQNPVHKPAPVRTPAPAQQPQQQQQQHQHQQHSQHKDKDPEPAEMRRQDSGYESLPPRSSFSNPRRTSTASSSQSSSNNNNSNSHSGSQPRPRGRPTIRRAPKTSPYPTTARTSGSSLYRPQPHAQPPVTFFHFPAHPTDVELAARRPREDLELDQRRLLPSPGRVSGEQEGPEEDAAGCAEVAAPLPPQATHYWTSDRTRRLEYAAIDAASRGVKGWVRRHLVPDCFVPKEKHVAFDDDTGSVRRYRLELDEEAPCEKGRCGGRRRSWFGWKRSKTA